MWKGNCGDSYIGEWKQGKTDGYGVHKYLNGDLYILYNEFIWTLIIYILSIIGDVYEGLFKTGLKHGEGAERFAN